MNKVIKEQEIQNEILEKELQTIKQGGGNFSNFESLLGNTNNDLVKIKQILGVAKKGRYAGRREAFPEDFVFR